MTASQVCLLALAVATPANIVWAADGSTAEILDTVALRADSCTISIVGGSATRCAYAEFTTAAEVDCGPGAVQVREPWWFLDGETAGAGNEITMVLPPGTYALEASCGSCRDEVTLWVEECATEPGLDAAFSQDSTEATWGIFLSPNIAPIAEGNFEELKFLMRPFTLSASESLTIGGFGLEIPGDNLEVFQADGTPIDLPAYFPVHDLPAEFLLNAAAPGDGFLVAGYRQGAALQPRAYAPFPPRREPVDSDTVRVRVGPFPGLAGGSLSTYPHFEFARSINDSHVVRTALDPARHAERTGLPFEVYVVDHRTPAEWAMDDALVDVSGGCEIGAVTTGSIAQNVIDAWTSGLDGGEAVGKGYDVVYDFGLDGALDPGDLVDGLSYEEAGFYIVRDLGLAGPRAVATLNYSGGQWLTQRTYYPATIADLGQLPLVVVSHGNGHYYTWYEYLGHHLASYGYVVMAHTNNTRPGVETASTTTLTNTDFILTHQDTIGGGVLNGHIDGERIIWIGHSRGGEGVVRAYDRIHDEGYTPGAYGLEDIILVSSIAPTVYLGVIKSDPHDVNYHLIAGAADGDVTGGADCSVCQFFRIPQAGTGNVHVTYVQGASHNDFNCCGPDDGEGPDLIGREAAQVVAESYYLALVELYARENRAAKDYFTRMYERFHPSGIGENVVCATTYKDAAGAGNFVIDDFQSEWSPTVSSSGGAVTYDVSNICENGLNDIDWHFGWTETDPMNGMTQSSESTDQARGMVFDWSPGGNHFYEYEVIPGERDFSDDLFLSFRACQGTRHPETVALGGTLDLTVTLRDGEGATSSINSGGYGGLTHPYQRGDDGPGLGWANEFSTVRLRLADFQNDDSGVDLTDIAAVRFEFGEGYGSPRGRLGLDDVELAKD